MFKRWKETIYAVREHCVTNSGRDRKFIAKERRRRGRSKCRVLVSPVCPHPSEVVWWESEYVKMADTTNDTSPNATTLTIFSCPRQNVSDDKEHVKWVPLKFEPQSLGPLQLSCLSQYYYIR